MNRLRGVVSTLRHRTAVGDTVLATVLAVIFLVGPRLLPAWIGDRKEFDLTVTGPDVTLTLVSALALTQLRRRPLATLVGTAGATLVALVGGWEVNLAQFATAIAIFSYGLRRPRLHALAAAAATSVVLGATSVLAVSVGGQSWGRQDLVLWLWTATAIAVAVQSNRTTIAALQDRARRAEQTREETALRRVTQDRVRIARELHDVIAHHVAVISVQAGVAEHLLGKDTPAAGEALHHVRTSAKAVLAELQSVLGVLRQDESDLPTSPTPGISDLEGLVASFRAIGTPVTVTTSGDVPTLAPARDLAAFRLVQEALTNVQKHANGARATVLLARLGDVLEVSVTNDRARPHPVDTGPSLPGAVIAPAGSGLGLVGMRERVVAVGGELQTGTTPEGGFRVLARLPIAPEAR